MMRSAALAGISGAGNETALFRAWKRAYQVFSFPIGLIALHGWILSLIGVFAAALRLPAPDR